MSSKNIQVFIFTCAIFQLAIGLSLRDAKDSGTTKGGSASAVNASADDSLDDRFNLNFNVAQAQGFGRFGEQSLSNSLSYGVNAGIRGPNGQYQNLYNNAGSQSHGFSTGPGAPLTFANTGSRVIPGHAGGHAGAGVFGGRGSSFAASQNQNIEIPLDNRGTVLLSNLQAPNSTKSSEPARNPSKENERDPLVFT